MNITIFATGMEIRLGDFDAGWVGESYIGEPIRWRRPVAPAPRSWKLVPVVQKQWEEK